MFNFNFGKKKPDKKQIIFISIVLSGIVATLSQCSGVPSGASLGPSRRGTEVSVPTDHYQRCPAPRPWCGGEES
jgi:hypothetical protein